MKIDADDWSVRGTTTTTSGEFKNWSTEWERTDDLIRRNDALSCASRLSGVAYVNYKMLLSELSHIPAVDAVEVVRCSQCKWSEWYTAVDGEQYCHCMETGYGGRTADDFCSYGERGTE